MTARSAEDRPIVAAVDLGSHSFHMLVAQVVDGGTVQVIDKLKERVALADGLDENRKLVRSSRDRALEVLRLFGERLKPIPRTRVRAVGTNTLRVARNAGRFLELGSEVLGHPIEVISGREEARLIYLGVMHNLEEKRGRCLVVDIGGGSTECIIGDGFDALRLDSLYMGHVTWTRRFFADGRITRERMVQARLAAGLEVESIQKSFRELGWEWAVGSSGTAIAVESILRDTGWASAITAKGLRKLRKAVVAAGHIDALQLPGLQEPRRAVLPGGIAILQALFDYLDIDEMRTSAAALREGLVHDLLGRLRDEDVRDKTVGKLMSRYRVDEVQAGRVGDTAVALLKSVAPYWDVDVPRASQILRWASSLHEIGLSLSYAGYHRHGAYILENSDMPGFSREGQRVLAALVLCHRRKIRQPRFQELPGRWAELALQACILLRLAWRLNRQRSSVPLPELRLEAHKKRLNLIAPTGWLEANPLARADLTREKERLEPLGYDLELTGG